MSRYLIGIDLGTTNSAVAFIDLQSAPRSGKPPIQTFQIPQLVNPGETGRKPLLPSFLYLPGPHDLPAGSTKLPWNESPPDIIGEFGRNHGGRIPGRLVTLREIVAMPFRRGSHSAVASMGEPAGGHAAVAARSLGPVSSPHGRGLESLSGEVRRGSP